MSYEKALEVAGAKVLAFAEFGDYQGTWIARVIYKGEERYISGCYGSCSGCDAFWAEFDYYTERCEDHRYEYPIVSPPTCKDCQQAQLDYNNRLVTFGEGYLNNDVHDKESLVKEFTDRDWDSESVHALEWLAAN